MELRGGHTARLLAAAGLAGSAGAIGLTLLVSGHRFGHHPSWDSVVFSAVWAGLLVVMLAVALLRVRTPTLPLSALCFGLAVSLFAGWLLGTAVGTFVGVALGLRMLVA